MHAPIYAFLVQLGETTILLSLEKAGNHQYNWGIIKAKCHQCQPRKCKEVFLLPSFCSVKVQVETRDNTYRYKCSSLTDCFHILWPQVAFQEMHLSEDEWDRLG